MKRTLVAALLAAFGMATSANAAFLLEIDTDGLDDGVLTFNPNFSLGTVLLPQPDDPVTGDPVPPAPGVMSVSQSSPSSAVGMTGGDSVFGGTAASTSVPNPDTYIYTYTPAVDGANLPLPTGTLLNEFGDRLTGVAAGGSGVYEIYATWPDSGNISFNGLPVNYVLEDGSGVVLSTQLNQDNDDGGFNGNQWISLGQVFMDANTTYTLTQTNSQNELVTLSGTTFQNGFVSMRAAGLLFVPIPEPTSAVIALLGVAGLAARRRG